MNAPPKPRSSKPLAEPVLEEPETSQSAHLAHSVSMPPPQWSPVPPRPARTPAEVARNASLFVALALLAISIAVAYASANSIVSIWFERQWVPVVRLVLAILVAAAAGAVILRLTRRKA